jgi:hypothetical protein
MDPLNPWQVDRRTASAPLWGIIFLGANSITQSGCRFSPNRLHARILGMSILWAQLE